MLTIVRRRTCRTTRRLARDAAKGQSLVELALTLPLAVVCLVLFVQLGAACVHQMQLQNVARETARVGTVESAQRAVSLGRATSSLDADRLAVNATQSGGIVRVVATYREEIRMPYTKVLLATASLRAHAAMYQESPS